MDDHVLEIFLNQNLIKKHKVDPMEIVLLNAYLNKIIENLLSDEKLKRRAYSKKFRLMKKHILLNCFRKNFNLKTISFEEEFKQKQKQIEQIEEQIEPIYLPEEIQNIQNLNLIIQFSSEDQKQIYQKQIDQINEKAIERGKKQKKQLDANICEYCKQGMIEKEGVYFCTVCAKEGKIVQKQSYAQSGNISGTSYVKGLIKQGKIAKSKEEQTINRKAKAILSLFEDYARNPNESLPFELYTEDNKNVIWGIVSKYPQNTNQENKIIFAEILFNDIKRRNVCRLRYHLNLIKKELKIKKDISYLLTTEEEEKFFNKCFKFSGLLKSKEQKIFNKLKKEILEEENLSLEQISGLIKFMFYKKLNLTAKEAEEKVKNITGLSINKYKNEYNYIRNKTDE